MRADVSRSRKAPLLVLDGLSHDEGVALGAISGSGHHYTASLSFDESTHGLPTTNGAPLCVVSAKMGLFTGVSFGSRRCIPV